MRSLSKRPSLMRVYTRPYNALCFWSRFNYKTNVFTISGSLFPNWIMLLNASAGYVGVDAARRGALWRKRLSLQQQQTTVVLTKVVYARYIRVQLESNDDLTIAEIEAFTEREWARVFFRDDDGVCVVKWGLTHIDVTGSLSLARPLLRRCLEGRVQYPV